MQSNATPCGTSGWFVFAAAAWLLLPLLLRFVSDPFVHSNTGRRCCAAPVVSTSSLASYFVADLDWYVPHPLHIGLTAAATWAVVPGRSCDRPTLHRKSYPHIYREVSSA
jgi:hypothetical protein